MNISQFRVALFALVFVSAGCFQYVPPGDVVPTRGSPIRLYLERPSSFELTQFTINNVTTLDGEWVARDAGDVVLSAKWLESVGGIGFDGENLTVRIPEANINALEAKRVSWWRTGAALLGGAALTFFGFDALGSGTEGSAGGGGGGQQL